MMKPIRQSLKAASQVEWKNTALLGALSDHVLVARKESCQFAQHLGLHGKISMLTGIAIALRRSGRLPPMHPTSIVLHRAVAAWLTAPP
jgi:hypothetical protein